MQGTKDVLKFSYIGYKDKEITVGKQGIIDVKLTSENEQLDEVVVTAGGVCSEESNPKWCCS